MSLAVAIAVAALAIAAAWWQYLPIGLVVVVCVVSLALPLLADRVLKVIDKDEQILIEGLTGSTVVNGPAVKFLNPLSFRSAVVRKATTLTELDFCKVVDSVDGSERIERGPKLLFLGAYDKVVHSAKATVLSTTSYLIVTDNLNGTKTVVNGPGVFYPGAHDAVVPGEASVLTKVDYVTVEDTLTGEKTIVKGPLVWFPSPYERKVDQKMAISLQENQYLCLKDKSTGSRWIQKGQCVVFLEPMWVVEKKAGKEINTAWCLKAFEYIRLVDRVSGKITVHRGEKLVFPGPDEDVLDGEVQSAIDLKVHEYVKIVDHVSGEIRVEQGRKSGNQVFLGPNERVAEGGKHKAIAVDEENAVMVRDKATGKLRLITEPQLFVPGPNDSIENVQKRIRLADHEAMIIKDCKGDFKYYYGSAEKRAADQPRSFFLQPYEEIVKLCWSKGRRCDSRSLVIERFDCRPQFMPVEFNCRTSDNVEMVLEATFFWEVIDLPAMVKRTGDTSGDLCNHARSLFIQQVAKVTLKEFMDESHQIAKKIWEEDTDFYESRGVKIHSLEITSYACAERRTAEVLDQIIQETTNRMNRLSQAESENEVNLFLMQGNIEQEKLNGELLKIQHDHSKVESEVAGRAEGKRISAFVDGLKASVPNLGDRSEMWETLRKIDALQEVAKSGSTVYFTPKDVNLAIETRQAA